MPFASNEAIHDPITGCVLVGAACGRTHGVYACMYIVLLSDVDETRIYIFCMKNNETISLLTNKLKRQGPMSFFPYRHTRLEGARLKIRRPACYRRIFRPTPPFVFVDRKMSAPTGGGLRVFGVFFWPTPPCVFVDRKNVRTNRREARGFWESSTHVSWRLSENSPTTCDAVFRNCSVQLAEYQNISSSGRSCVIQRRHTIVVTDVDECPGVQKCHGAK